MAWWNLMGFHVMASTEGRVTPIVFLCLRQFLTTLIMLAASATLERGSMKRVTSEDYLRAMGCGLIAVFLVQTAHLFGLIMTENPTSASLFDGPMVVPTVFVLAICMGKEHLPAELRRRVLVVASVLLTVLGAVTVLLGGEAASASEVHPPHAIQGFLVQGVETLAMAVGMLLQASLLDRVPPFTLVACMCGSATMASLLLIIVWQPLPVQSLLSPLVECTTNRFFLLGLAYSVCVHTCAAMALFNYAAVRIRASTIAVFTGFQPPLTALLAAVLLGKLPTLTQLLGTAVVFAGLWAKGASVAPPTITTKSFK
jgi:drug/metabolite transporter (DMT)-like permease